MVPVVLLLQPGLNLNLLHTRVLVYAAVHSRGYLP